MRQQRTTVMCITHGVFLFRVGKDPFYGPLPPYHKVAPN